MRRGARGASRGEDRVNVTAWIVPPGADRPDPRPARMGRSNGPLHVKLYWPKGRVPGEAGATRRPGRLPLEPDDPRVEPLAGRRRDVQDGDPGIEQANIGLEARPIEQQVRQQVD